jgi:hypothetical protein
VRRGTAGSRSQLWVRKEEAEAEAEATNEWRKRRRPRVCSPIYIFTDRFESFDRR